MKLAKNLMRIRIGFVAIIILLLMIPWYQLGINFPMISVAGKIIVSSKYLLAGILLILFFVISIVLIQLKKKSKEVNFMENAVNEMASKILLDSLLIILAYNGFLSILIPVIIIIRDIIMEEMKQISADNGKMIEKSKLGIAQSLCMWTGILFLLFYNLPFELWNFYFADALVLIGTVLAVLTGCLYYYRAKNLLVHKK